MKNEEEIHRTKVERNMLHTIKRSNANTTGHIFRSNFHLKCASEGKMECRIQGKERRGRRRRQLMDVGNDKILEIEGGSTGSLSDRNSLWKWLRTCRKTTR